MMKPVILLTILWLNPQVINAQQFFTAKADTNISFRPHFSPSQLFRPTLPPHLPAPVPLNFYTQDLAFFCRLELKTHEAHIPFSFRLGSMDYCNMLEQKK